MVKCKKTVLSGILLLTPKRFGDHRGFFAETYSQRVYAELGIDAEFVQDNHSLSAASGTAWIQTSSATVDLKAAISSARASAGVLHPKVFLGRLFIRFATSFSHVWLAPFRSVPLGMN